MEQILLLVVLIALGALAYLYWQLRRARQPQAPAMPVAKTLDNLEPGDGIGFWDGENVLVDNVLDCTEQVGARNTRWHWALLSNGRVVEVAPDENSLYEPMDVISQGSAEFDELTHNPQGKLSPDENYEGESFAEMSERSGADSAVDALVDRLGAVRTYELISSEEGAGRADDLLQGRMGLIQLFEARVRHDLQGSRPVSIERGEAVYRIKSTGVFGAIVRGPDLKQEVWRDISPNPGDNVYFEAEADGGAKALGIWTSHVAWFTGRTLKDTDIDSIYPANKGG